MVFSTLEKNIMGIHGTGEYIVRLKIRMVHSEV
ncbi:hypothetical protein J2X97_000601 [Epilithonimonas hungarica]|nr:hypothetical protein [Epilithonimonas hungarica]